MGEPKPVNFRHELKYLISSAEVTMLRTRLSGLISLDAHAKNGHYTIRSLYFDDYDDRCLLENENGTDPREKFRIRIYNGSAERISLECKRKERGMTHKTSCPLTREQTELLMAGKIVPNVADQPPLLQKLTAQMMTRRLHPVSFWRRAPPRPATCSAWPCARRAWRPRSSWNTSAFPSFIKAATSALHWTPT